MQMIDGNKLAEAMRKVTPFIGEKERPVLHAVFLESHGSTLEMTTTDGYRMAHVTLEEMVFPEGDFLLEGDACKDFAFRHSDEVVQVEVSETEVKLGDVTVARVNGDYLNWRSVLPDPIETMAIVETNKWIKPLRAKGGEVVGVVYNWEDGYQIYFQDKNGETTAVEKVPAQMGQGPERKVAYKREDLRRALTGCAPAVTIKVGEKATLFEAEGYWHLLAQRADFPREVNLTQAEREVLKWAEDVLESVRKGEVPAKVITGGGRFYLELDPERTETEILIATPELRHRQEET